MGPPSSAVRAFINAYIESIDLLRVLLLLARERNRASTAVEVTKATALAPEVVQAQLQRLIAIGLVSSSDATESSFLYTPRAEELDQMVQELIQLDDTMPVTLIRMVYSRTSGSVQAFADAFRLRRP